VHGNVVEHPTSDLLLNDADVNARRFESADDEGQFRRRVMRVDEPELAGDTALLLIWSWAGLGAALGGRTVPPKSGRSRRPPRP
jgi:hypothetical protein